MTTTIQFNKKIIAINLITVWVFAIAIVIGG